MKIQICGGWIPVEKPEPAKNIFANGFEVEELYLLSTIFLSSFLWALVSLWSYWDLLHFTRIESDTLKRGIVVGRHPLARKTCQFLITMPNTLLHIKQHSLCKKNHEVLVVPESPTWWRMWGIRGANWPYVAYVNLSNAEPQIEFRVPLSRLITLGIGVITMMILFLFFYIFTGALNLPIPTSLRLLPLLIAMIMTIISVLVYHYRRRKDLLQILEQAMDYY